MPIYEYVCPKCETTFELRRPISQSSEPAPCPKCHQSARRKLSKFACFSTGSGGTTTPVGGSSCSSCGSSNCGSCGG